MKIALAIENFSMFAGGAEAYSVELAKTLVRNGWEVHLFGYSWQGAPKEAIFHQLRKLPKIFPPSIRLLDFAIQHRKLTNAMQFDVVLGFGNTIEMNVYQSHGGVNALSNLRKLNAIRNPLLRYIKRLGMLISPKYHVRTWIESAPFRKSPTPLLIAISDMIKSDFVSHFGVKESQVRLVYNGIDPKPQTAKDADKIRNDLGFRDEVLFLFMAYDFRKKGVSYLLKAAAKLKQHIGSNRFGLVIVGNNPGSALEKILRANDLARIVRFPGPTKTPDAYYAACDVFVLPTFYDACSLVVFEAMSSGLPVITTKYNGASGVLRDEAGITIDDAADIEALFKAMEFYIDPVNRRKASEMALKIASQYTLKSNHSQMIALFHEAARDIPFSKLPTRIN